MRQMNPYPPFSARAAREPEEAFSNFSASELFCPKCKQSMPVREKTLLVLADGTLFDYTCARCGTTLGTRKA